jgi:hypothetical protein
MDEEHNVAAIDDLELDEASSEAVRGGMSLKQRQTMIAKLEHQGFVGESCTAHGDVYVNPKTHQKKVVPFSH